MHENYTLLVYNTIGPSALLSLQYKVHQPNQPYAIRLYTIRPISLISLTQLGPLALSVQRH